MNVMWLDEDLHKAAKWHPTKYTKLILEAGQCLCSALHNNGLGEHSPYGKGYNSHPISVWAGESVGNWFRLRDYMDALTQHYYDISYAELQQMDSAVEYWENNTVHKTTCSIADAYVEPLVWEKFPDEYMTEPPKCVSPESTKVDSVVETYRRYFVFIKSNYPWFEWSDEVPDWYETIKWNNIELYRQGQAYALYDYYND